MRTRSRGRGGRRRGGPERDALLRELLSAPRFEVLPTSGIADVVAGSLPAGRTVTVTASVSLGFERMLSTVEQLQERGYRAVPHIAARMVAGRSELAEIVERLTTAGVTEVFVPAGDAPEPAGDYASALDLLRDLAELGNPFAQVGIAGYPESHPHIPDRQTIAAMTDKRPYADCVVSNLCFDPAVVADWIGALRERGETLPVKVGVPGKVDPARLLKVASAIGVGESTRFLSKNTSLFARLLLPGGFSPERYLRKLAGRLTGPEVQVSGLHVYTFNQVAATEEWRERLLAKLG
ncbi:methylenetetrahydrofolate reductase [Brevibacterium album]|uniref:methylenetetrahydrofolate reductase n=1 Tax=Brevibacterium album TaxID=417948 RepID=UPI00068652A5|nr:methylenetetrahydrofolate reductase [Brevibacterium album]